MVFPVFRHIYTSSICLGREKEKKKTANQISITKIVQICLQATENACDKGIAMKCKGVFSLLTVDCKGDVKDVQKILNKRAIITCNVDKKMCMRRM